MKHSLHKYSHMNQTLNNQHNWVHNSHTMHMVNTVWHLGYSSVRVSACVGEEVGLALFELFSHSVVYRKVLFAQLELVPNFVTYWNPCKGVIKTA